MFRIRVGRQMNSAALIADGYHARTDGLTSLAVVFGALGVWLGYPLADPIIGLMITVAIFGIVWQSSRAVVTRMLDGADPGVVDEIRHAVAHVAGIDQVVDAKAPWLGHDLHADVTIAVDDNPTVSQANTISVALQGELRAHMPMLAVANVRFSGGAGPSGYADVVPLPTGSRDHHHAPDPFKVSCELADGLLEIVDTPEGERMRLTAARHAPDLRAFVTIDRPNGIETHMLVPSGHHTHQSAAAPAEPHEFTGQLRLSTADRREVLPFSMTEPAGHHH